MLTTDNAQDGSIPYARDNRSRAINRDLLVLNLDPLELQLRERGPERTGVSGRKETHRGVYVQACISFCVRLHEVMNRGLLGD
jgi:hypothetical protein